MSENTSSGYTREQLALLKRTVGEKLTQDEFLLFVETCKSRGLDPFAGHVRPDKRWSRAAGREIMSIQTQIGGYRAIAHATGEMDGYEGPWWCGTDGNWVEVWLGNKPPAAAKVLVYRKGRSHPFPGIVKYSDYVDTTKDGKPKGWWAKGGGAHMLAKCAEAQALQRAFPERLSGLYTQEEMAQADNPEPDPPPRRSSSAPPASPPAPEAASGNDGGGAEQPPANGNGRSSPLAEFLAGVEQAESINQLHQLKTKGAELRGKDRETALNAWKARKRQLDSQEASA